MKLPIDRRGQAVSSPPAVLEALLAEAASIAPSQTDSITPPGFLERCRAVGRQASELQRLRAARRLAADPLAPLREHCRQLASLAKVQLAALMENLAPIAPRADRLTGWIRLGQLLGLPADEMRQRVRLEFLPRRLHAEWSAQLPLMLGRSRPQSQAGPDDMERRLAAQESTYPERRSRDLTRALAALDVIYGQHRN